MDILKIDDKPFLRNDNQIQFDTNINYLLIEMITKRLARIEVIDPDSYDANYEYVIDLKNFQIICVILTANLSWHINPGLLKKMYNGLGSPTHLTFLGYKFIKIQRNFTIVDLFKLIGGYYEGKSL